MEQGDAVPLGRQKGAAVPGVEYVGTMPWVTTPKPAFFCTSNC